MLWCSFSKENIVNEYKRVNKFGNFKYVYKIFGGPKSLTIMTYKLLFDLSSLVSQFTTDVKDITELI